MDVEKEDLISHDGENTYVPRLEDRSTLLMGDTNDVIMNHKSFEKVVKIGKCISSKYSKSYFDLLHHYFDIFSWSSEDMLSIDEFVVVHNIVIYSNIGAGELPVTWRKMKPFWCSTWSQGSKGPKNDVINPIKAFESSRKNEMSYECKWT